MNGRRGKSFPCPSIPLVFYFSNFFVPVSHHCRQEKDTEDERVAGCRVHMGEVGAGKDNERGPG